jgi:integrase
MSLYKRKKIWHADFSVDGQRFRQSLETTDWRQAQAKKKELIVQASEGKLAASNQRFSRLRIAEALDHYLEDRSVDVLPRSHRSESDHAKELRQHLGTLKRKIRPTFDKLGITGVGWHTFRHTVGTVLAELGEHQLTIRDYLRHSNLSVTNKYLQAASNTKRNAQARLVAAILPVHLLPAGKTGETVAP